MVLSEQMMVVLRSGNHGMRGICASSASRDRQISEQISTRERDLARKRGGILSYQTCRRIPRLKPGYLTLHNGEDLACQQRTRVAVYHQISYHRSAQHAGHQLC